MGEAETKRRRRSTAIKERLFPISNFGLCVIALRPFKPGQSGNPGGKPTGARNFLQARFLKEMAEDFDANGRKAIERMREERPADYIRAIASLMPATCATQVLHFCARHDGIACHEP